MNSHHVRLNYREIDVAKPRCGFCGHNSGQREVQRGFSLVEILIAMSVGMVVLGLVYNVFTLLSKQFTKQEVVVEMQQNARMAMDIITREILLAGYNPARTLTKCSGAMEPASPSTTCVGIRSASAGSISLASDLDGDGDLTADDTNSNENIVYDRGESPAGSGIYALRRKSNNGTPQPAIENLDFLGFSYFNAGGGTPTDLANIRKIRITIRVKAAKADPAYPTNGGFRTYTLVSDVTPRNLGL
jgi:type IV pilus assembly protein PilW